MTEREKEIKMTWDMASIEKSLPRDGAFTFMHLLAMTGQAPVEDAERTVVSSGAAGSLGRIADNWRARMREYVIQVREPTFSFLDLLALQAQDRGWARLAYGDNAGLEGLALGKAVVAQDGWANDDWRAPANANETEKVA